MMSMKKLDAKKMGSLAGACGLLALAMAGSAMGQAVSAPSGFERAPFEAMGPGAAGAAKRVQGEENEGTKPNRVGAQGIKMHGHWVLQLKNADGTLGERREFENSLVTTNGAIGGVATTTSGSAFVAAALSGNIAVSNPGIGFVQGTLTGDPSLWCGLLSPPAGIKCNVFTSSNSLWNSPGLASEVELGLNISATYAPTASIILTGNYTVPSGVTLISAVQALFDGCAPIATTPTSNQGYALSGTSTVRTADISAQSCTITNFSNFLTTEYVFLGPLTSTAVQNSSGVPTPLAVVTGQVITVTVTLSFS